jgi:hypothetical protein
VIEFFISNRKSVTLSKLKLFEVKEEVKIWKSYYW